MNENKEENPVLKILTESLSQSFNGDKDKISGAIETLGRMVQQEGCKLIHLGNTVFVVSIVGSRMVEFHALVGGLLSEEEKIKEIDKELSGLLSSLKNLGVLIAYTTMPKEKVQAFSGVLSKHRFVGKDVTLPDGKPGLAFYVSLEK